MPIHQPVVFPLRPILPGPACTCVLGANCGRIGKHPDVVEWRDIQYGSPVPRPTPGAGYAIRTGAAPFGSGIVVVDIDGPDAVDAWLELCGGDSPDTYTVRTGRGLQLYFQHPGFPCGNTQGASGGLWSNGLRGAEAQAIDTRGDGGFVVGPGSPHKSGAVYELVDDRAPAPLPGWLRTWFQARPARPEVQPSPDDVQGEERARRKELYGNWLANEAEPCVAGQGGDLTLFKVVQKGAYDLALPVEDVVELIAEHYDHRCDPPWGDQLEERVIHKAKDAKERSTRPRELPLTAQEAIELEVLYAAAGEVEVERTALVGPKSAEEIANHGFPVKWGRWSEEPVPPDYLVDRLLVEGKVSMIFAEPGTIKSWTAIEIASAVSVGRPWLDEHFVVRGPVLYVDFEDGEFEFHRRVHMLTGGEERPDLGYVYAPGNIVEKDWWTRLGRLVVERGIKLVVIDTLAGATPGVDENDRNAADPLTYAGRLTENANVTVLFLHHANRAGDIRGTSAFKATVDTLFKLESVEDRQEDGVHRAKLTCVKSGQKKVPPVWLELTDDGLRKYTPERPQSGEEQEEDKKKRTITEIQQEVLLLIESEGPFASVEIIRERVQARKSTIVAILAELHAQGAVYRSPEGWARDNEGERTRRLKEVVTKHGDWGKRALIAAACVPAELFDRLEREKVIAEAVKGSKEDGYIWRD